MRRRPPVPLLFARSLVYRRLGGAPPDRVRETPDAPAAYPLTERHLRCVWYDAALRPADLRDARGEPLTVEHPGHWNLEAGPDFLGARLRLGSEQRRVHGDVEIHVAAADWRRHGHDRDPAYRRVIAHVTYFPGCLPTGALPAGAVQVALKEALQRRPGFAFESIDLTAYPFARPAATTPCGRLLAAWSPARQAALLEAAGEERLRRKMERLAQAVTEKGLEQALYEDMLQALGYKQNRAPFRALAERVPCARLQEACGGEVLSAYALLMGVAGLLPERLDPRWDAETVRFIRGLWDRWWKHRDVWRAQILPATVWTWRGVRPPNHPRRRLMAAALWFAQPSCARRLWRAAPATDGARWVHAALAWLQPRAPTGHAAYWQRRTVLGGAPAPHPIRLVGADRAAAIVTNVLLPLRLAVDGAPTLYETWLHRLPVEANHSIIRQAAHALLGGDHNPALYRTGLRQQGLMQIFYDCCLHARVGCEVCALAAHLRHRAATDAPTSLSTAPET